MSFEKEVTKGVCGKFMFTAGVTSLSLAFVLTLLGTGLWMSFYKDIKTWLQK
jgi:hypothetical protein